MQALSHFTRTITMAFGILGLPRGSLTNFGTFSATFKRGTPARGLCRGVKSWQCVAILDGRALCYITASDSLRNQFARNEFAACGSLRV